MSRQISQIFEDYQRARVKFAQTVAELAKNPLSVEALQAAGVMALLRPLLLDNVPSIQQSAALALGRLASYTEELAEAVVAAEILPQLVYSLAEQNRFYKKSAALVLRAVAKHSPTLAQSVVDCGAVEALVGCLEEFDPSVKEAAAWALGYIARHTPELAQAVVDNGAVPLLVFCVQEPEFELKRIAASCLADIAKHSPELAQVVVDAAAIPHLAPLILSSDAKLKRQVCQCLAQIAKHGVELAELVVEGEVLPNIFTLLKDADEIVRKNAATCIRELSRHTVELAQLVVNAGGLGALVEFVSTAASGAAQLPGIMTLGYISAFSETLALAVIVSKAIPPLGECLAADKESFVKAAAAWSLGQIGRHSADHAKAVADCNVLPKLLECYVSGGSVSPNPSGTLDKDTAGAAADDVQVKSKTALKFIIQKCVHLPALQPLLKEDAPPAILKHVCAQFAKVLPLDVAAKREFVASRGLAVLQKLNPGDGPLRDAIQTINNCYPPEIVQYYSPDYQETFMDKIDSYQPAA